MMEDTVQFVLARLKDKVTGQGIKEFYDSDPDAIPDMNLPALIVSKQDDEMVPDTMGEDTMRETILVKLVMNKADDWTGDIDPTNMTERKLRNIMEGRNASTGQFLPNTVKGALRSYVDNDERMMIERSMRLEIGSLPRPNNLITIEAHLTITVTTSILLNS